MTSPAAQPRTCRCLALAACAALLLLGAPGAPSAAGSRAAEPDEALPGTSLQLSQQKAGGTLAKLKAKAEGALALPVAGDPTVGGAALVLADGGLPGEALSFDLPAAGWKALGSPAGSKGYAFKGGPLDACRSARLTPKCEGETGWLPAAGEVHVVLTTGGAKRYCARFGGVEKRNDAQRLKR